MSILRFALAMMAAAVLLSLFSPPAFAAKRVALVIGNAAYEHTTALRNPVNDATDMARALRALDFEVVEGLDLSEAGFDEKRREFAKKSRGAEVTLLFYAGHGLQMNGQNYLVPVDAKLEEEIDLDLEAIKLDDLMGQMRGDTNLVFLDACRDNPLARGLARSMGASRSAAVGRGLAQLGTEGTVPGMLIAYATQPGNVAKDGEGRNSPFTGALLKHIGTPGQSVNDLLTAVTDAVMGGTNDDQRPWVHFSLRKRFYFKPLDATDPSVPATIAAETPAAASGKPASDSSAAEQAAARAYEAAERVHSVSAYKLVTEHFPESIYAALALEQIAKLTDLGSPAPETESSEPPPAPQEVITKDSPAWDEHLSRNPGKIFWECDECPELVVVPAGSFTMGSPRSEEGRWNTEGPQHRVTIPEPFAVGKYEVTFAEWDTCVAAGGCQGYRPDDRGWGRGRRPVIDVSWEDAKTYVGWLSRETGERYRLLSEAEWEYAARAGTTGPFHFGATISTDQANYDGNYTYGSGRKGVYREKSMPVGSFSANAFGLHDVHGNVREWVEDCRHDSYAGAPTDGSAWVRGGDCGKRVLRGGSWFYDPRLLRSAFRFSLTAGYRNNDGGFRVSRTLTP